MRYIKYNDCEEVTRVGGCGSPHHERFIVCVNGIYYSVTAPKLSYVFTSVIKFLIAPIVCLPISIWDGGLKEYLKEIIFAYSPKQIVDFINSLTQFTIGGCIGTNRPNKVIEELRY